MCVYVEEIGSFEECMCVAIEKVGSLGDYSVYVAVEEVHACRLS